jgi:hypothetical protein
VCLLDEPIEVAGLNVGFELTIPFLRVKLSEPGAKHSSVLVGETPHSFFDFSNRTHLNTPEYPVEDGLNPKNAKMLPISGQYQKLT